jgi:hypothetical protein
MVVGAAAAPVAVEAVAAATIIKHIFESSYFSGLLPRSGW